MLRSRRVALAALVALSAAACASTSYKSTWKAPDATPLNFKGRKVAALIISKEEDARYEAESALAREITARGAVGIPAFNLIPKEIVRDKEKAKEFLEKADVAGVVAMRVVGQHEEISGSVGGYYSGPNYATFWGTGYYGWGWSGVYEPGYLKTDTIVSVETLVFSLEQNKLVFAARSQSTNPSKVGPFIKELAAGAAAEMKKQGLIR
jgi:hypothetical protein